MRAKQWRSCQLSKGPADLPIAMQPPSMHRPGMPAEVQATVEARLAHRPVVVSQYWHWLSQAEVHGMAQRPEPLQVPALPLIVQAAPDARFTHFPVLHVWH